MTLAFTEVYSALQRGVVDGAVTGVLAGNLASWNEVSGYLYLVPVNYSLQLHVANLKFWNSLTPEMRDFLSKEFKEMEEKMWQLGEEVTQDGVNCNTGVDPCRYGKKGNMKAGSLSPEDKERMRKVVEEVVLPHWGENCNKVHPDCVETWNKTAGEVAGIKINLK